ncbi:MAG TPA: NAD(P)/FAD-dependent oxidoreductase [Solirubrobacteraceae bacterium]|nr:NAD(P)/FAD-dependent oxidoreductase [Solirubrobacteraceae bacterium]
MPLQTAEPAPPKPDSELEHVDVLIVGAGLSGIGAACHLQARCPSKSYAILEAREAIGGTWDLFRYPGIRSDSDMYTLGYSFRPWRQDRSIADGASIRDYVRDTAREHDVERHIRFGQRVVRAEFSSEEARWSVEAERADTGERVSIGASFLLMCSGYYRYDEGYSPQFAGIERFQGEVVHPQHWPEELDYAGRRVVVIGSGATAVTLVPAMAQRAAHVTMLQRSPSYVLSLPAVDPLARLVRRLLPEERAYALVRWKNVLLATLVYQLSRRRPGFVKGLIRRGLERQLPPGYDIDTHFKPTYDPWDQRLCLVPDGDLFAAIAAGRASVATDTIDSFTEHGIRLSSGAELDADVVVTATGLNLLLLGGASFAVDGREVDLSRTMAYKGMMLSGVPNMAMALGYTNASWTLKCDLTCEYVCRLLNHMDAHGHRVCEPHNSDPTVREQPLIDFSSGYIQRSIHQFPKQGSKTPWRLRQNYPLDILHLRRSPIEDGAMRFAGAPLAAPSPSVEREALPV